MGLIAWFPLNGELKDYSGNNRHLVGENIVVSNQGKIGKCLEFNANPIQKVYYKEFPRFTSNFTWSCWINVTALGSTRQMILSQGRDVSNFGINIITDPSGGVGIAIGTTWKVITYDLVNKWTHLALAVDTSKVRLYINGVLQYETDKTEINFEQIKNHNNAFVIGKMSYSYTSDTTYFPFNGKINDVRIYDEALSLKEIREMAKAKILHYNFNQFAESTTNLADFIGSSISSSVVYSWLDEKCPLTGEKVLKITRPNTVGGYIGFTSKISSYKPNTKYTYTIWYRVDEALSQPVRVYCTEYNSSGQVINYRHHISIQGVTNGWVKQTATWTSDATASRAPTCNVDWLSTASTADDTVYIGGLLLEEKDHSTKYCNGTRTDRVTDSSGFRNHSLNLSKLHTPQWKNDSVIGSGCYYGFGDGSTFINVGDKCKPKEELTISFWIKMHEANKVFTGVLGGVRDGGTNYPEGISVHIKDNLQPFVKFYSGSSKVDLTSWKTLGLNTWHHVVITHKSDSHNVYIDGENVASSSASIGSLNWDNVPELFVGKSTQPFVGNKYSLGEIRIYATALSDDDIKELYQSRGSVSKNGKLMVNEIVEVGNISTSSSVNKKGQLKTTEIIEYPSVNLETKTAYGADWVQLFYHNNQAGTVLFTSDKQEFLKCNIGDKISNLYLMELFRGKDGKFEFLLEYQSGDTSYNRWKQTSNFTNEPVVGYEPIQCSWTNNYWGGLEPSNNTSTWVDGSVSHGNWFYAIGGRVNYGTGGLPSWNGVEPGWVKIWVRCDNPSVFKMYKNGTVSATEFIEN